MQEYHDNNRKLWDGMVPVHDASDFYEVASFMSGRNTLMPVELHEVGDAAGKSMLHLQYHFGMDTLSWARLGAQVTGIDFSAPAIVKARELSAELRMEATFIESNVYRLPEALDAQFDMVFCLVRRDLLAAGPRAMGRDRRLLRQAGGCIYIVDGHPFSGTLDEGPGLPKRIAYPYDSGDVPVIFDDEGSYADRDAVLPHTRSYEFHYGIGEIVTALIDAGLRIEFLHEFRFAAWQRFPDMTKADDGYYHSPSPDGLPLMFSIKATKPE
jgi:hypothetical protein